MKLSYKYLLVGLLLILLLLCVGAGVYSAETAGMLTKISQEPFKMLLIGIGFIGISGLLRRRTIR